MQNIIITGASHGIGRALTKKLSKKYHIINIDSYRNKMRGENVTYIRIRRFLDTSISFNY